MADLILGISGVLLSLIFSYVPKASDWFGAMDGVRKRLVMLGLCAVVTACIVGLACSNLGASFGLSVSCDQQGIIDILKGFGTAVVMNQTAYMLSPQKK